MKGDPVMGDLIRAPHSEIHDFIERLDALGVSPRDLATFRAKKAEDWSTKAIGKVLTTDPMAWASLQFGDALEELNVAPGYLIHSYRTIRKL